MPPRGKVKAGTPESSPSTSATQSLVATARGLAEIVAEHNLSELILDTKDVTLTVRRGGAVVQSVAAAPAPIYQTQLPAAAAPAAAAAPPAIEDKAHVVMSPFVGTFYRKPNPDSPNYVSLGDQVSKGQALCIVEAMKLMNEIEADVAGKVTAILVDDGAPVEYNQPLFKITV